MRVLGIDPGSTVTGFGIVEKNGSGFRHIHNGSYRTSRQPDFSKKLREIFGALKEVLEIYRPDAMAIEKVFLAKNAQSALRLGESRGVAVLAAALGDLPVYEYSTREVKQALTGYGQATKEQIQKMVQRVLQLNQRTSEDASDALAVAICHLQSYKIKEMINVDRTSLNERASDSLRASESLRGARGGSRRSRPPL